MPTTQTLTRTPTPQPTVPQPRTPTVGTPTVDVDRGEREYQHLQPLLDRYASLAPGEPEREILRERLVTGYLPVAKHIARRYANRGEPLDDLVQIASVGLVHAVDRYEPGRGSHFLGYAVPTITGEIRRHFRDKSWSMRVPRRLKELHLSVNGVVDQLSHELQRAPRPSEIASRLNLSTEEVLEALQVAQSYRVDSLDEVLRAGPDASALGDLLGDTDARLDRCVDSHALAPHIAALPARERQILIMRFFDDMTQTQIAQQIGISQMHVSRILTRTLAQLRAVVVEDRPA